MATKRRISRKKSVRNKAGASRSKNEKATQLYDQRAYSPHNFHRDPGIVEGYKTDSSAAGKPLAHGIRSEMEAKLGAGFGNVQVHTDEAAHNSAAQKNAKAYAVGEHLFFSKNRYAPEQPSGKRLLAHELAHVMQHQKGGGSPVVRCAPEYGVTSQDELDRRLQQAVHEDDVSAARDALREGADPNAYDEEGYSAVHSAADKGSRSMLRLLLNKGGNVEAPLEAGAHRQGWTPLIVAAEQGQLSTVRLLMSRGADMRATGSILSFNAPGWAARGGHSEVVKFFLRKGYGINEMDPDPRSLLHHAAGGCHADLVRWLLDKGADPNLLSREGMDAKADAEFNKLAFEMRISELQSGIAPPELREAIEREIARLQEKVAACEEVISVLKLHMEARVGI